MFEGYYTFNKANVDTPLNYKKHLLKTHIYRFKTEGRTPYIVHVEEYPGHIFIIKFFRKKDRNNKNRFNIVTNEGRCTKIVTTCIRILVSILHKVPDASFGFLGAHTVTKSEVESKTNTQRFRIYKFAMENRIGENLFVHSMDEIHSTYLMVNKANKKPDAFVEKARKMFEEIFPELEP